VTGHRVTEVVAYREIPELRSSGVFLKSNRTINDRALGIM